MVSIKYFFIIIDVKFRFIADETALETDFEPEILLIVRNRTQTKLG